MENGSLVREIESLKARILDLVREETRIRQARTKTVSTYNAQIKVVCDAKDRLVNKLDKLEVDITQEEGEVLIEAATGVITNTAGDTVEAVVEVATSK